MQAPHDSDPFILRSRPERDDVFRVQLQIGDYSWNSRYGYASKTACGMAARARVVVYKVCWVGGCFSSNILAAMEKVIDDSVNVMSMSLGGGMSDYYPNNIAIGASVAMERGILVSCSAENVGPSAYNLSNVASWITTFGARTLDSDFPA